jgi:hypothetical protein
MSPKQIERRKEWVLGGRVSKRGGRSNYGAFLHQRGYDKGDIRCSRCLKWINPNDWQEAREIEITPSGRRVHGYRYCRSPSSKGGSTNFSTVPKYSGGRRRMVDSAKRY